MIYTFCKKRVSIMETDNHDRNCCECTATDCDKNQQEPIIIPPDWLNDMVKDLKDMQAEAPEKFWEVMKTNVKENELFHQQLIILRNKALRGDFPVSEKEEPEDESDIICQSCFDPDCNRPFPHTL